MPVTTIAGRDIHVDAEGFLTVYDEWDPDLAKHLAAQIGIDLTDAHWTFYAGRYLDRHGLARDGLRVHADFDLAIDRPARVAAIRVTVQPPDGFPASRLPALTAVAGHCTVHNTLANPPEVTVTVT